MPETSIIVPAYNREKHLHGAIESLLKQTYQDFEIIIVDDGSIDMTRETANGYIDAYPMKVRYIYQNNRGPGAARNLGIKVAKGKYIAFLDSDDIWLPKKLEEQISFLKLNPEYKVVFCDYICLVDGKISHNAYIREKDLDYVGSGYIYRNLLKACFILTSTIIVSKDCLEEVGLFREDYLIHEDYELFLRIAKKFKMYFLDKPLSQRLKHKNNLVNNERLYHELGIKLFRELLASNSRNRQIRCLIEKELSKRYFSLGYFHWENCNLTEAKENFICAWKTNNLFLKPLPYIICANFPDTFVKMLRKVKGCLTSLL